jgi:hypothetical protein
MKGEITQFVVLGLALMSVRRIGLTLGLSGEGKSPGDSYKCVGCRKSIPPGKSGRLCKGCR